MRKIIFFVVIIAFGNHHKALSQVNSTIQGDLSDLILEENDTFYIQQLSTKVLADGFVARYFVYKIKTDEWIGGVGFEISHPERSTPLWYTMINGDFGPHSVQLIDVDQNGKLDLFYFVGFEDVFSTYIYSANFDDPLTAPYRKQNFVTSYQNRNSYSVLIQPDGADQPLILDSGVEGDTYVDGIACSDDDQITISDSVKVMIETKYRDITRDLDQYNFDYNMPDVYFLFNTMILDPIKIIEIRDQTSIDVTAEYPDYLEWRIGVLNQIKSTSSQSCEGMIQSTIEHLRGYLR